MRDWRHQERVVKGTLNTISGANSLFREELISDIFSTSAGDNAASEQAVPSKAWYQRGLAVRERVTPVLASDRIKVPPP